MSLILVFFKTLFPFISDLDVIPLDVIPGGLLDVIP